MTIRHYEYIILCLAVEFSRKSVVFAFEVVNFSSIIMLRDFHYFIHDNGSYIYFLW